MNDPHAPVSTSHQPIPGQQLIRVAAIMDTRIISGPGRQLAAVIPPLRDLGFDVHPVLFHRTTQQAPAYADFLAERGIAFSLLSDSRRFDPQPMRQLVSFLRLWRPDIVQTHSYRPSAMTWWLRRHGAPWRWVGFFHGLTTESLTVRLYHMLDQVALRHADRVVVMAQAQLRHFRSVADRTRVMSNAIIDTAPGASGDAPPQVKHSAGNPVLAVVGRLSSEKGVDVFLRALALLHGSGVQAGALIAGDGPDRRKLESLADRLGLGAHVTFLGQLRSPAAVYAAADVVVLPSRSEGLPNVLLEAIRAGLPVAATSVGAVPEVLFNEAAGAQAPPGDSAALAGAIRRAIKDGKSEGANLARKEILDRFSLARRVSAHVELYSTLVNSKLSAP